MEILSDAPARGFLLLRIFNQISDMSRIFSLFFLLFFAAANISYADDNSTYLVEDVVVSVTNKTPSAARIVAVATARRDAFLILLTRIGLRINLADNITNDEISEMVRSEQIEEEKIAGNNYSATFNIMFAKDFVEHILAQKTIDKTEEKKEETYLLIPAEIVKRKPILWEEENHWKMAIEKNLNKKAREKFIIPQADVANLAVLNRNNVELVDYLGLEPMISRYNTSAAYTLFFNYDEIENKVTVSVTYLRKLQKKIFKLGFVNVDRLDRESLMDKVAIKTIEYLLTAQPSENKILTSGLIHIGIPISSLGNWLMIKNKIESSGFVSQLNTESISRDYVLISVNYVNGKAEIDEAFAKIGLPLDKKSENFYQLDTN
jgi:hypothetical protein